jgi:hypothetical protein
MNMTQRVGIDQTLQTVREHLETVRSELEALSGAIWQSIDHEDDSQLAAGVRFKQRYNERRTELEKSVGEMLSLLRDYPRSGPGRGEPATPGAGVAPVNEPVPTSAVHKEAAEPVLAAPVGDLDKKVPFGFVLGGQTITSASAWPLFYEALLQELYGQAPEKLSRLADEPGSFTQSGRPLFARVPDRLDDPLPIADAIFAEADMHPQVLLQVIGRLVSAMGYPLDGFKILLKEKNRGTIETLSLAA